MPLVTEGQACTSNTKSVAALETEAYTMMCPCADGLECQDSYTTWMGYKFQYGSTCQPELPGSGEGSGEGSGDE